MRRIWDIVKETVTRCQVVIPDYGVEVIMDGGLGHTELVSDLVLYKGTKNSDKAVY